MKKCVVCALILIFYSNLSSQSIGVSGSLAKMSYSKDVTTGFNVELSIPILSQVELSLNSSFLYKNKSTSSNELKYSEIPVSIEGKYFFNFGTISPYACVGFGLNYIKEINSNNPPQLGDIMNQYASLINVAFGSYIDLWANIKLNTQLKVCGIISNHDPLPIVNVGLVYKL